MIRSGHLERYGLKRYYWFNRKEESCESNLDKLLFNAAMYGVNIFETFQSNERNSFRREKYKK